MDCPSFKKKLCHFSPFQLKMFYRTQGKPQIKNVHDYSNEKKQHSQKFSRFCPVCYTKMELETNANYLVKREP